MEHIIKYIGYYSDGNWKHIVNILLATTRGFLSFIKSITEIPFPGFRSFVMEICRSPEERLHYWNQCQHHSIIEYNEMIEFYRLSIQYKLPLTHSCRKYFY